MTTNELIEVLQRIPENQRDEPLHLDIDTDFEWVDDEPIYTEDDPWIPEVELEITRVKVQKDDSEIWVLHG